MMWLKQQAPLVALSLDICFNESNTRTVYLVDAVILLIDLIIVIVIELTVACL